MSTVLLDTHVWVWTFLRSAKLSARARAANDEAAKRVVSAASFYEISQKVRLGKWPEMAPFVDRLVALAEAQGIEVAGLNAAICLKAGGLDWPHRDPFDRLIAATVLHVGLDLVSADEAFDGVVPRIW